MNENRETRWPRSDAGSAEPEYESPCSICGSYGHFTYKHEELEALAEHWREAREVEAWQEAKHARRECLP